MSNRREYFIGAVVVVFSIVLMLFFYWKSGALDDTSEHQRYVESIRHLQASDAILDQHLLRLRNGTVTSVDRLNEELAAIHRLESILGRPPENISAKGRALLLDLFGAYQKIMKRKELLVERFKAENANLKTSIVYYPILSQELVDSLRKTEQGEPLTSQVQELLRDILLFNLNTNPGLAFTIEKQIGRLEIAGAKYATSVDQSQWNPRQEFEDLSIQGYTILRVKPGVDTLINDLMAIPVAVELENFAEEYHLWYNYAIDRAMFYRFCLYFVAVLTVMLVAWLIIRSLDQRIKRATQAIAEQRDKLVMQLAEREAMSEVAVAVSTVGDVDQVLDTILEKSREVVNAEASSLLLLDEDKNNLRFHIVQGEVSEILKQTRIDIGQGLAGHVAKTGNTEVVADPYNDPRFSKQIDADTGFVTRSLLTTALSNKGKIIGVLQMVNRKELDSFNDNDISLIESFAAQAAVAIENSRLYTDINNYVADLKESLESERRLTIEKEKMGAYVPQHLVDEISRSREKKLALGGKVVRATIMFSDIAGFTLLSERLEPQQVVDFLNLYMTEMSDIIENEGGIIDKFIGDGIMAVFIMDDGEQAMAAVRAGLRMQEIVMEHRESWGSISPDLAKLNIRVGINTGQVISGNVGSERRMDYTVIGDNVNVAARIEGASPPGGVLVSLSTYEDIKLRIEATEMEPIMVKNREQAVLTYAVQVGQELPARKDLAG